MQPTLFDEIVDDEPMSVESDYRGIGGLTYVRGFLPSREQKEVWDAVHARPWLDDLKRKVQHYGYKYDYKVRSIDASMYVGPLPAFAVQVAQRLLGKNLIEQLPDQMIVNHYEPGQGIAAHIDCEPCFGDTIVTVSLGSAYEMDFKSIDTDETERLRLDVGSALILRGDARVRWTHGIKPRKNEDWGPRDTRVSLTFRNVILHGR